MNSFSASWRSVIVSLIGTVALWSCSNATFAAESPVATLKGHTGRVHSVAFSLDGKTLASASADKSIKLWELSDSGGKERATLSGHEDEVSSVLFSPDGKMLVSASADKTIRLWDVKTGKELAVLRGHTIGVAALAFNREGTILASASLNLRESYRSEVKLWDCAEGTAKERVTLPETHAVSSLAFSPDGKTLVFGGFELKLWDIAGGKALPSPKWSRFGKVVCVAYSPDGKTLAYSTGYSNRPANIVLLDLVTQKSQSEIGKSAMGLGQVVFAPDGKTIAVWGQGYGPVTKLVLWDPVANEERTTLATDELTAVAFSRDSKQMATAEREFTIKVWNASWAK